MKLFGFNIQIARNRSDSLAAPARKGLDPAAFLRGDTAASGGAPLANAYQQVPWVYRAVNAIAEQVGNVPFLFSHGERGRENLVTSGPLHDFYDRPHPQLNSFQYWELRVMWLLLRGECFRIPVFSPGGKLLRVLLPDPGRFQHILENHELIGWRYTGSGPNTPLPSQVFLPEEVWFERLPNPFDFWRGLSPLHVAASAARTDYAAGAFMRGLIENNADAGLIVRTEHLLDEDQQAQIIAALNARKRQAGVPDRPLFLSGVAEIVKPGLSSSDLQFLENRKFTRGEICAAFGVPEEIITTTDHNKYDVMDGARRNFIENRVAPLCARLEAEEQATIRAIDPAAGGWFDLDSLPLMQQARRQRLEAAARGFALGIPFNDLNQVLDLGFKPLPWGNIGYLPANLVPAGRAETPARAAAQLVASPRLALPELGRQLLEVLRPDDGPVADPADEGEVPPGSNPTERRTHLARRLRRFFFEQRVRVLSALAAGDKAGAGAAAELLDVDRENEALEQALAGLPESDSLVIAERKINEMTLCAIEAHCRQSRAAGEPAAAIRDRLRALYNELARRRAPQLAQALLAKPDA